MTLDIRAATGTPAELNAVAELRTTISRYDLRPWTFTRDIVVEENAIPHSHPILTLSTRNGREFQLASLLHEQMHWFCAERDRDVERVYRDELLPRYPTVPAGPPDGARDSESTYLHLIVCWQEIEAMTLVTDRATAERVATTAADGGLYRWIYRTVLADFEQLRIVYAAHGLCPPGS